MSEPYIPSYPPFHIEPDDFRVWEGARAGSYVVTDDRSGQTYRGPMTGVVRFIERIRLERRRG